GVGDHEHVAVALVFNEAFVAVHLHCETPAVLLMADCGVVQGRSPVLSRSTIVALALVVATLRADAALRGLQPALGGVQFLRPGRRLLRLEAVRRRGWMRIAELLPGLRLAVVFLLGLEQLARVLQRLLRRDTAARPGRDLFRGFPDRLSCRRFPRGGLPTGAVLRRLARALAGGGLLRRRLPGSRLPHGRLLPGRFFRHYLLCHGLLRGRLPRGGFPCGNLLLRCLPGRGLLR